MKRASLARFAWLSIAAAIVTIVLKTGAYFLTGSVGLLSDALESVVNLAAALMALAMLTVASRPPDTDHAYGHAKAEYFASSFEGMLILVAAGSIGLAAWQRLLHPRAIEQIGWGLVVSILAALVNFGVARVLLNAARHKRSITLEADARHLMTDVWTSIGVVIGVGAVALTGYELLDPIIAFAVAANIVWSGVQLVRRSVLGLLDTGLPLDERTMITTILDRYRPQGVQYHALRTRQAAGWRFMSVHILVPGHWTVLQGHRLLEQIERDIRQELTDITVLTHLEPLEDPTSWDDIDLDRAAAEQERTLVYAE